MVAPGSARTVVLINGDQIMAAPAGPGRRSAAVMPAGPRRGGSLLTLGAGGWRAAFTAATGSHVTLRATAADAAGGRISDTITRAYEIAP